MRQSGVDLFMPLSGNGSSELEEGVHSFFRRGRSVAEEVWQSLTLLPNFRLMNIPYTIAYAKAVRHSNLNHIVTTL